jgi:hypothetical protein
MLTVTARRSWEDATTTSITLLLGAAAFAGSYTHIRDVAADHGQGGWISYAIAASVDFMAVGSGLEIRRRRRNDTGAKWPMFTLLLSVGMTLGANLATAGPGPWGVLMAVWPAVAFLSVAGLLETRTRRVGSQDGDGRAEFPATELGPAVAPVVTVVAASASRDNESAPAVAASVSPTQTQTRHPTPPPVRKADNATAIRQARADNPTATQATIAATVGCSTKTVERHWPATAPKLTAVH